MKVIFWHSSKPRERLLAEAFLAGVRAHGDEADMRPLAPDAETMASSAEHAEVACMVGVKSRELYRAHTRVGVRVIYLDKGYVRGRGDTGGTWLYWRVSVGAHHPTQFIASAKLPSDRWDALGLKIMPWRTVGKHIVFAGSSEKYHAFYGLRPPTPYAAKMIRQIHTLVPGRPIVYRPKPSWRNAEPVPYSEMSTDGSIFDVLNGAHALVTHGSNAVFEAMLAGVPSVVLGDAVARPISSTLIEDIVAPRLADEEERHQLLANLAYFQWTLREMHSGATWAHLRPLVFGL